MLLNLFVNTAIANCICGFSDCTYHVRVSLLLKSCADFVCCYFVCAGAVFAIICGGRACAFVFGMRDLWLSCWLRSPESQSV